MKDPKINLSADGRFGSLAHNAEPNLLAPFQGVRLKLKRARTHVTELAAMLSAYEKAAQPQWHHWWEPHYEHLEAWWLEWSQPKPDDLPLVIGDIAHNIRAALDIMICDLARTRGRGTADLKFPFAENEKKWREACAVKELQRIGPDAMRAITALGAYRDGPNSGLRTIHDLDVLDKHRLVIPTFAGCWAVLPTEIRALIPPDRVRGVLSVVSEDDIFLIRKGLDGSALPKPATGAIAHFPFGMIQIVALAGKPVLETLIKAADHAEEIIETFAARFS